MAKYRPIKTCFWSDEFISSLSPNAKLLYLYLLTNERTNLCGVYRLPAQYISFETGLKGDILKKSFSELERKITYCDGWILIKNYKKHQSASPSIKEGIKRERLEIPDKIKEIEQGASTVRHEAGEPIPKPIPIPKGKIYKKSFGENEYVKLSVEEFSALEKKIGMRETKAFIQRLDDYVGSTGKKYKSHYHTVLAWWRKEETQKANTSSDLYSKLPKV